MSVEKLSDNSHSIREQAPFAQILNNVIENIKDNDAFRMYAYLCSKDRSWKVIKQWTAKICGVGEKKARACWSYLARCGLIKYVETRDEKGKIIKHDIHVLVGYEFDEDEPFLNNNQEHISTGAETAPVDKTHRGKNRLSGKPTRVDFASLLNKDITNKEKKINKDKSSCVSRNLKSKAQSKSKSKAPPKIDYSNGLKHDWAPMMNEKASIERNESFKRAPAPPELKDMIAKMKSKLELEKINKEVDQCKSKKGKSGYYL